MEPAIALNPLPLHATGILEINTKAIAHNYNTMRALLQGSICAAVLKANAYGFGANAVARTLAQEGCEHFFVAHLEEGLELRHILKSAHIYVLSGLLPGTADLFVEHALTPILNDYGMAREWARRGRKLPCGLHFDTGMHRNGFDKADTAQLFDSIDVLDALDVQFVMSHLVSSHDSKDPLNKQQKDLFDTIRKRFPEAKASLADTGGVYLRSDYHYDIARVGKGLFGLFPPPHNEAPLLACAKLLGRILQVRTASCGESVGYGATHTLMRDSKLATIGIGFADGFDRRLQNSQAEIHGHKALVVGRISMDYTVIDVTDVPEALCEVGAWAELVNETLTLDALATSIGTISRELSTGFGDRLHRVYV